MFTNFDMDKHFVKNWNIFSNVIRALCSFASRTATSIGDWDIKLADAEGMNSKGKEIFLDNDP